jgi:hypothetical protein
MAKHGIKGFAYISVKLVLLANGTRYVVDSNPFFLSGSKALYPFNVLTRDTQY